MQKAVIIADDFTGANDTGVQLRKCGFDTGVFIDPTRIENPNRWDAIVIDTESRSVPKEEAYNILSDVSETIKKNFKPSIVYKKIDSTLRGNISAEIRAICEHMDIDIVVFSPAYPQIGRTTVGGVHLLNGVPINETELANDPKNPVKTAVLKDVLTADFDIPCDVVTLNDLRHNLREKLEKIRPPYAAIFDVETPEDLSMITQVAALLDKKILWVGSAGLANALFENCKKPQKPVLSVVGSVNSVSIEQYNYVVKNNKASGIVMNAVNLLDNEKIEINRIINEADRLLGMGMDVIISTTSARADYEDIVKWAKNKNMNMSNVSKKIADSLGTVVNNLMDKHRLSGLFITGGDIAISAIKAMRADGSVVVDELETGIPVLKILGGPYDGTNLITKAGGFGKADSISHAIKYLKDVGM
ncbi:four-carbon acid sugar kinase family protein [Calorimonas adulescens]|uniref:Four-carbon acid sugar kinase family protein n=1 Tax=Calorimonas adulescens TaxID=2606906 RepID=A0A5D8QAA5_9THEO|nr:four-carbon acid sugar kinase family protein [Calorimonas adulescens]TZE81069.1 four-carbon acid sugar kinase family protein [Calorimonas adulescens]